MLKSFKKLIIFLFILAIAGGFVVAVNKYEADTTRGNEYKLVFEEIRQWQIASDSITVYQALEFTLQSKTKEITCSANTTLLVVCTQIYDTSAADGTVTGVTYDGASFTEATQYFDENNSDGHVSIWYLQSPTVSEAHDVIVTTTGGAISDFMASVTSVQGATFSVDATATPAVGTSSPTITFSTNDTDTIIFDSIFTDQAYADRVTADSPQVSINITDLGSDSSGSSYDIVTASGPQTMSWTDTDNDEDWVSVAVAFKETFTISGTADGSVGSTVKVAFNGAVQTEEATIQSGTPNTWSIAGLDAPAAETVITVWIDGVVDSAESTGVTEYKGADSVSGMVLDANVLTIGSNQDQSLTVTNFSQYDCLDDEDIMHNATTVSTTLEVAGVGGACSNSYDSEKIDILSGDTVIIYGTRTLITHDVEINGTLTSSGASTYTVSGSWDNNGVFTADSSTVTFTASSDTETIDSTGASTDMFNNLTLGQSSGTATWNLVSDLNVDGVLSINYGTLNASSYTITFSGWNTPLVIGASGVFTPATSTVKYISGNPTNITAATFNNLELSSNSSIGWTISYDGIVDDIYSLVFDSTNNVIYAGSGPNQGIIYRCAASTGCNEATDWTVSNNTVEDSILSLAFDSTNGVIYAGTNDRAYIYRCATSTGCDEATDWTLSYDATGFKMYALVFDSTNSVIYAGSGENEAIIYRCATSTECNEQTDWTTSYDTGALRVRSLVFDSANSVIYAGDDSGIISRCATSTGCDEATDWTESCDISASSILSLVFDSTNNVICASDGNGIIYRCATSTGCDEATDWTESYDTDRWDILSLVFDSANSIIYAGSQGIDGIIYRGTTPPTYTLGTASSQTITTNGYLTIGDGTHIMTVTSNTYDPILDLNSNFAISANGTLIAPGSSSFTVAGNWTNSGTFTHNSGTVTFDGSSSANQTVTTGGQTFYNFTANNDEASKDDIIISGTLDVDNTLTVTDGNLEFKTNDPNINTAGDVTIGASGTITKGTGTWTFDGSSQTITDSTSLSQDLGTVTIGPSTTTTVATTTDIKVTDLTIGADDTLNITDDTLTITGDGTPFTITSGGTFTTTGSTVKYTGIADTNITATTYNNLGFFPDDINWTVSNDTAYASICSLVFDSANNVIYAGTFAGGDIYRCATSTGCDEGTDWTESYDSSESRIESLVFDSTNSVIYAGTYNEGIIYRCATSTGCDEGTDWTESYNISGSTVYVYSLVFDSVNNIIYAGSSNGNIHRCATSTGCDEATDWTESYDTSESAIYSLVFDSTNSIIYAGTGNRGIIYRCAASTGCDEATDWTESYDTSKIAIRSLVFDSVNNIIYAGSNSGTIYRCAASTGCDEATDWTESYDTSEIYIYSLVFDSTNGVIYAGTRDRGIIYRCATSTGCDAAADWTVSYNPDESGIYSLVFDSANSIIYAGTAPGGIIYQGSISTPTYTLGTAASQTITANGYLTIDAGINEITVTANTYNPVLDIDSNFTISANGTFIAPASSSFTVGNNWTNSGTFTHNSGTVSFDGSGAQTINDANTWYGLSVTTSAARTVSFESSVTQTIASGGSLNFTGASGQLLTLAPLTPATAWLLDDDGAASQSVSYVSVSYSNAGAGAEIDASDGTNVDGDNNTNWSFTASGITVSGRVCSAEPCNDTNGSGACSVANVVGLSVDGGAPSYASCNTTTGAYSFSSVSADSGATITLFLNDNATDASAVVVSDGNAISDGDFYDDTIVVRSQTGTATINDMMDYDSDQQTGDIRFDAETGVLNVEAGHELHIWTGDTFAPGGTVTLAAGAGSDLHIDDSATFTAGGAISIGGSWTADASSTFTHNNNNVTFTAGVSGQTITTNTQDFYNLIFDGSSGEWTPQDAVTVANDLTSTNGTIVGTQNLTVSGGDIACGASCGSITLTGGTTTLSGTGNFGTNALASNWTFYDLTFGDGAAEVSTSQGTGTITVSNVLTIAGSHELNAGNKTWTLSKSGTGAGKPLVATGTFTASTSTVSYEGGAATDVTLVTYNNLTTNGAGPFTAEAGTLTVNGNMTAASTGTFNLNEATNVAGNVSIESSATLVSTSNVLTIGGNYSNANIFTHNSGEIIFNGNASAHQTVTTNDQAFYAFTINNDEATYDDIIISGALDVDNTLTVTDGDLELETNNPSINTAGNVTIGASGMITKGTGTWTFDGSSQTITDSTSSSQDLGTVTIGPSTTTTVATATDIKVTNLTIGADDTLNITDDTLTITGDGTPFTITSGGIFTTTGSTVKYAPANFTPTEQTTSAYSKYYPELQISDSTIYYVWEESDGSNNQIWTATSNLDGTSFTPTKQTTSAYDKSTPQLQISGSTIYYTWREDDGSYYQIWTATSNLDGTSFTPTKQTTSDYYKYDPQLQISGSTIYYVWEEYDTSNYQIWTATSNLDGTSFTPTEQTTSAYDKNNPQLQISGSTIYYAWYEYDGSYHQIWTATSNLDGTSFTPTKQTTSAYHKSFPQLQIPGSTIYYVWREYDGSKGQIWTATFDGHINIATTAYNNLTLSFNTLASLTGNLTGSNAMTGNLTIDGNATLDTTVSNYNITLAGNWTNKGTFTCQQGTVLFDGSGAQTINDANTWYGLSVTTSTARTVSFESGVTQTVASGGSLTFTGASGQLLTLAPLTPATKWLLNQNAAASQSVSYVSVSYSNANAGAEIDASDGTNVDGTNNDNWNFAASGITVSGRVCSAEPCNDTNGSGACSVANVVGLSVDGGSPSYASCNTTTGAYSFSSVSADSGATITLFLNDNATDASAVVVSDGNTVSDGDFYDSAVVVRSQTGTATIADMMDYDSDQQTGDIRFDAETGVLNVEAGHELHIWTGDTFAPGGTVTLASGSGSDIHLDDNAVFTAGGAISIGGSWTADASSTFTHNDNNVTFTAGVSGQTITTNGQNFYNLIFNGSSGVWTATTDTLTVANNLTVTNGNFDTGSVNNTITGATSVTGTLTISSTTGTKTFTGDVTVNATGTWNETAAEDISFGGSLTNNQTFTASTGVHTFTGTGKSINGTVAIPNLTISGTTTNNDTLTVSTALSGASTLTNAATGTLNIGGTSGITGLTATTSGNTVNYNGTDQTVKAVGYHHLTLSNSGAKTMTSITTIGGDLTISGAATMTGNAAFTVTGALNYSSSGSTTLTAATAISIGKYNQTAGTFADNANTITVTGTGAGTWTKSGGTFTATGTATFTGSDPGIGASNFNNLIINVSGTATLEGAITVGNDLTISAGTLDISATNYGITVSGNWDNNGIFTRGTGTVTFNGTSAHTITDGKSPFHALIFDGAGTFTYTDEGTATGSPTISTTIPDSANATVNFINARTGTVSVSAVGTNTLNVDWYLGVHVVEAVSPYSGIDTSANAITISENSGSPESTVWRYNSGWGSPAASQTTDTDDTFINPQPSVTGAIKIREYAKTNTGTTYYLYNLQIDWQTSYGQYDYYDDYPGTYLTSSLNSGTIGSGWHRADPVSTVNGDGTLNNTTSTGTWYVGMLSGLDVTITGTTITFDDLNSGNSFTDDTFTGSNTTSTNITVTTSATNGYVVTAWETQKMTHNDFGTVEIDNFNINGVDIVYTNTNTWTNNCSTAAPNNECGFGFTSRDPSVESVDRYYNGGGDAKYAGFPTDSASPIIVMDYDDPANGISYDIDYRISASNTQRPGTYSTTIVYVVTAEY